jgi:apolipoprotein N-acyltransferase
MAQATASAPARPMWLASIGRWRARGTAMAMGAASVLALAPFFAWPVLFLTLPGFVWLLDDVRDLPWRVRMRRAAALGWWFGFGYFAAGLFWIGEAFLVEAEVFAWLLPFAVTAMPAGLALFWAAASTAASAYWPRNAWRILSLALTLSAAEWLRGHILTGLPWNVLGYAFTAPLPLMQSSGLIGIYGLTLLVIVVCALPLVTWFDARAGEVPHRWRIAGIAVPVIVLCAMAGFGWIRMAAKTTFVDGVRFRLVQPSVAQRDKWRPEHQERIFFDHLALSRSGPAASSRSGPGDPTDNMAGITHIVWPEAAMPFLPLDSPRAIAEISSMLGSGRQLITGALRVEQPPAGTVRTRRRLFNSLMVFGEGGRLEALYDKIHLVPFGEYLPLQDFLESIGLEQLTRFRGGFTAGSEPRPLLNIAGLPPIGGLVCYEAIFPAADVQGHDRPGALINVTNDGWVGNTTGPRQHFHQARVRAVEEGLPLIRVANNGISAVIDPYGRVLDRLDLNVRGAIDSALPSAIRPPPYARIGDAVFFAAWLTGLATLALRRLNAR